MATFIRHTTFEEAVPKLRTALVTQRFWWVHDAANQRAMVYDSQSRLLWEAKSIIDRTQNPTDGKNLVLQMTISGLHNWRLPSKDEMIDFVKPRNCPLRDGQEYRLLGRADWLTADGCMDLDKGFLRIEPGCDGLVLACSSFFMFKTPEQFIGSALQNNWSLFPCGNDNATDLLALLRNPRSNVSSNSVDAHQDDRAKPLPTKAPANVSSDVMDTYIDYRAARLPKIEIAQFTDPNKGLWEFWGRDAQTLKTQGVRARNPADDVRDWNVAIDFGTSSTVVAYNENGRHKLLRIGIKDFFEAAKPEHYENPTVLEFVDLPAVLAAWQASAYRPGVQWDHVRCAHEALHNFRNNETDPRVVGSILTKIKQWALREGGGTRVRVTDWKNSTELELAPLTLRSPVKGKAIEVSPNDPFDPVELYAWFLGLTINWRGRGIFLRYFMTFPVAYPSDVKEKVLASFRRGLQRSLPATLVTQPVFENFTVAEMASEPAAYAATALKHLKIQPTTEGVAYGVFDFGGGTADFDFGLYRLPNAEEEDEGWEQVFEHFGAAGDRFLGGENLLENMAYRVFCLNLDVCRAKKIAFTRPLDADDFAGSEMFLDKTQAAATNTLMLMAKLRPLWETGKTSNTSGVEKIDLLPREGDKVLCEFKIPVDALKAYLQTRIQEGVKNFFAAMHKAFAGQSIQKIHVLLAGNASRSSLVSGFFNLLGDDQEAKALASQTADYVRELFQDQPPEIISYPPLPMDEKNVYQPTGKTGVALGLLHLCPGGVTKVINHVARNTGGEAPFAHYVGRIRQGKFQPGLVQGESYGKWCELGPTRDGVFNLIHSQSPKAHTGDMCEGEAGLFQKRLDLVTGAQDKTISKVFARAKGPAEIEICTAASSDAVAKGEIHNLRELKLG